MKRNEQRRVCIRAHVRCVCVSYSYLSINSHTSHKLYQSVSRVYSHRIYHAAYNLVSTNSLRHKLSMEPRRLWNSALFSFALLVCLHFAEQDISGIFVCDPCASFFCQSDAIFSLFWLNEIVMLFVVRAHTVSYIVFRFQFLSFALCFVLLLVYGRVAVNSHIHHSDMARVMCVTLRQRNIYCSLKIMNSKPHAIHHFDNGHYLFDKIFVIGPGVFWESHRRLGIIGTVLATCPTSANLKVLAMHTTRMDDVVIYCCHHSRHIHACI